MGLGKRRFSAATRVKWAQATSTVIASTSTIVLSATVAARDSGRRREPWQSGQTR